jgi:LmbE family N-acetylglucosaminyl deacetylase
MEEAPQKVLVVTPHPGDAEFWCAGTIATWVGQGASVHYLLCTNGGKGTTDSQVTPDDLAVTREAEQQEAAGSLGVREVVMLHYPDGELEDTKEFRKQIVRQIRRVQPEVVLCPEPYRKNLAWHRDHRIGGQVTLDAVFPFARDHLHFLELWEQEGLEPYKTGTLLFWGAEQPDTHIDISNSISAKVSAVLAHQSQMRSRTEAEVEEFVKEWAANAGAAHEYKYAEAFRKVTFRT